MPIVVRLGYQWLLPKETLSLHVIHRHRLAPKLFAKELALRPDEDEFQWFMGGQTRLEWRRLALEMMNPRTLFCMQKWN